MWATQSRASRRATGAPFVREQGCARAWRAQAPAQPEEQPFPHARATSMGLHWPQPRRASPHPNPRTNHGPPRETRPHAPGNHSPTPMEVQHQAKQGPPRVGRRLSTKSIVNMDRPGVPTIKCIIVNTSMMQIQAFRQVRSTHDNN